MQQCFGALSGPQLQHGSNFHQEPPTTEGTEITKSKMLDSLVEVTGPHAACVGPVPFRTGPQMSGDLSDITV